VAEKQVFSISEAAQRIGRNAQTLRNWDASGKLVADRTEFGDRIYRVRHLELAAKLIQNPRSRRS